MKRIVYRMHHGLVRLHRCSLTRTPTPPWVLHAVQDPIQAGQHDPDTFSCRANLHICRGFRLLSWIQSGAQADKRCKLHNTVRRVFTINSDKSSSCTQVTHLVTTLPS